MAATGAIGSSRLARLLRAATAGPSYVPTGADLREAEVAGVALPIRATVALAVATAVIVLDETRALVAPTVAAALPGADPTLQLSIERFVLFGIAPLLVVVLGFRDAPSRYGLTLGEWRWGAGLLVVGLAVMTPIIGWLSTLPDFVAYYGPPSGSAGSATVPSIGPVVLDNVLDLGSAEFLLRGFLLFVLLRRIGPLAIVVVQVPFILTHVGKPELELWSTFMGGTVFAWLDWRTRSVVWSAIGHVYILTLMIVLAGGART